MQTVRSWALSQLARKFPKDFNSYYQASKSLHKSIQNNSRARSKALIKLSHFYPDEYRELYLLGCTKAFLDPVTRRKVHDK